MKPLHAVVLLSASLVSWSTADDKDVPKVAPTEVPAPKLIKPVKPEYPEEAKARGLRGIVILELIIDTQGKVASVEVRRSVPPFDEAALAAVRKWEYEVTRVNGKPVSVRHTVPITFTMPLPETTRDTGIPELRQGVAPVFPSSALDRDATVMADVTLDPGGQVAEARVTAGDSPWSEALLQALRTWVFMPEGGGAILSFRVRADFIPAGRGGPRVGLKLSGLRRSEPLAQMEPPRAQETPPEPPSLQATPSPAVPSPAPAPVPDAGPTPQATPPPAPSPASTPKAAPSSTASASPPVEVLAAPAVPTGPSAPGAPAGAPEAGASAVRDVSLSAGVPDLIKGRRPVVPPVARMAGVSANIEVRFSVDAAGLTSVQGVTGPDLLKSAAEQTVASWVFRRTSAARLRLIAQLIYSGDSASAVVEKAP